MENYLTFKGEKYYNTAVSNIWRTLDGKKIFYMDKSDAPIWLSSDSHISIELRDYVMMDEYYSYIHPDLKAIGVIRDLQPSIDEDFDEPVGELD